MRKLIFPPLMLAFFSLNSHAGVLLKPSFLYQSSSSGQATKSNQTRTILDATLTWVSQKGWLVGGMYASDKTSYDGGSSDLTAMGPSVGWLSRKESGPYIVATYFYEAKLTTNLKGTGYGADLGYKFDIRKLSLGIQMSYRHYDFTKAGTATLSPAYTKQTIDPEIALLFEF
jgi:hypothetical protein